MTLLTWTKEQFGTNIAKSDEEHQTIFALVNQLVDHVTSGNRQAVGKQLDALIDFVVKHFKMEEDLMQANGYPDFAAHKAKHDELVATCADLQKKFHAGQAEVTADTAVFVKDWLYHHIPNVDKHYGPFLNSKGVA
ncbi:bacteriohemerythrin [Methylococcus sp. EFPC2]|uniref:bacteriohemerythrin n=1 Tax=Methylococcus sp. EFPC2 TaxID=2812648 RepID=UPI00196811FD|nr:bacteriohemerythrin [Methylococcus sp. EFPC2]QSA96057.1 hemerythrin family protein [Methylococcus sp. EFPC2]